MTSSHQVRTLILWKEVGYLFQVGMTSAKCRERQLVSVIL